MEFDYFYNRAGDRFSYYMLPKIIVRNGVYTEVILIEIILNKLFCFL